MDNKSCKIFHKRIPKDAEVENGSIIFITDPEPLNQNTYRLITAQEIHCVLYNYNPQVKLNPIEQLLNAKEASNHFNKIKSFNNILEMYVEKKQKFLDFLFMPNNRLFEIGDLGYCFYEYPYIDKDTLTLDDVFILEITHAANYCELINYYINLIINRAKNETDKGNIRNAYRNVFLSYCSHTNRLRFNLNHEDIAFLAEVLRLDSISDVSTRVFMIGALTAATSYFVHDGQPYSYGIIIEKLMNVDTDISYKHITQEELNVLKRTNEFLYFHLTCRIPNQYAIALLDMYLIEKDTEYKLDLEKRLNHLIDYLKIKLKNLENESSNYLWEFKRSQETGAIYGSIGQIILYKSVILHDDLSNLELVKEYIKKSIMYAHPKERDRNYNYYIYYKLVKMIKKISINIKENNLHTFVNIAGELASRLVKQDKYNPYDIMIAANLLATASVILDVNNIQEIYKRLNFDWDKIVKLIETDSRYATYLISAFLCLLPQKYIDSSVDVYELSKRSSAYFKGQQSSIMDLISVKLILAHAFFLMENNIVSANNHIEQYKKQIKDTLQFSEKSQEYINYLDQCMNKTATKKDALILMYTIPY